MTNEANFDPENINKEHENELENEVENLHNRTGSILEVKRKNSNNPNAHTYNVNNITNNIYYI